MFLQDRKLTKKIKTKEFKHVCIKIDLNFINFSVILAIKVCL